MTIVVVMIITVHQTTMKTLSFHRIGASVAFEHTNIISSEGLQVKIPNFLNFTTKKNLFNGRTPCAKHEQH